MAPLPMHIPHTMPEPSLEARGLNGNHTTISVQISPSEGNVLQYLALTFSLFSVASSILAFYWFTKMRRSFRHDLIMLLIQSDMFKALWFMIYPIVVFCRGQQVRDDSVFCQVNGFFLSLGIEASDFAILMIAIHTALYIFKPKSTSGEGGLYPYRKWAYAMWIIFPLLMASLAFVNGRDAYISEGTYCYLPVRPFWYRLALGWVPRYVIFVVILGIYASIYYYVRYKFRGFNRQGKANSQSAMNLDGTGPGPEFVAPRPIRNAEVPPTPTLLCHGLIPEARQTTLATLDFFKPKRSTSRFGAHRFMWSSFTDGNNSSPPSEPSSGDGDSFHGPSTPRSLPPPASPEPVITRPAAPLAEATRSSPIAVLRDGFARPFSLSPPYTRASTSQNSISIPGTLHTHPGSSGNDTPLSAQMQLLNTREQEFDDAEMLRTREIIRRQLRFLFIYPLVYIGMWILPFVSHVLQYDDRFAINPPFALTCMTTISMCAQAAIDCWLFSTREKPWRHIPGTNGGFWVSLKFWSGWAELGRRGRSGGPGRTRDEMIREARAAYRRRDEEAEIAKAQRSNSRRTQRSWWEGAGVENGMSPLAEEVSNPMENVAVGTKELKTFTQMTNSNNFVTSNGESALMSSANMLSMDEDMTGPMQQISIPPRALRHGSQESRT